MLKGPTMAENNEQAVEIARGRFIALMRNGTWEYAHRIRGTSVVAVIALTDTNELVLTRQWRIPVQAWVIDLPAGLVGDDGDPDEAAHTAARRELQEETGFTAARLVTLGTCPTSPGLSDECVTLIQAHLLTNVGSGGGVGGENITILLPPRLTIYSWLATQAHAGDLIDLKVYAALGLLGPIACPT